MQTLNLIGADWSPADSGGTFPVLDPADDALIAEVPACGADEARRAIIAADSARDRLAGMGVTERCGMLSAISTAMDDGMEDLAVTITREQGKPLHESRAEIQYARGFFDVAAREASALLEVERIGGQPAGRQIQLHATPIGTTAAITPWNFPVAMLAKKLAPALAMGCSQVIKPAEQTPLSALAFAELCLASGVPAGALSVITGDPAAIGREFLTNPLVRKLSFTGSSDIGRLLRRSAGDHLPQLTLELGGHAPFIVMAGADLDAAVAGAITAKFRNAGQACISPNRFLVEASIHDEFLEKLVAAVSRLVVGHGMSEDTDIGPLINDAAMQKVEAHVADALEHGAQCLLGGARIALEGLSDRFYAPTVLGHCTPGMLCFREETFGPVCPVRAFASESQAVDEANDSPYGLAAFLFTGDRDQGARMAEALEVGIVGVNDPAPATPHVPFGGVKESGWGREGSVHGLEEYAPVKTISFGD